MFWDGIPPHNNEHSIGLLRSAQNKKNNIGQLCDDGCIATSTATHFSVVNDGLTVLEGNMSSISGMWRVNLQFIINNFINQNESN